MVNFQPIGTQKCKLLKLLTSSSISPPVQRLHFQVILNPPGSFPSASGAEWFRHPCYITFLYGQYLEELVNCCYLCSPPSSELVSRADVKYSSHPPTLPDTYIRLPVHTSSSASLRRAASCVSSCFIHNQLANLITAWWRAIRFPVSPTLVLLQNWGHPSLIYEAITCNVMKSPSDQDLCRWNFNDLQQVWLDLRLTHYGSLLLFSSFWKTILSSRATH